MNFLIAELALFENLSAPDLSLACHPQRFPFTILPDVFLPPPVRSRRDQPLTSVIIAQWNNHAQELVFLSCFSSCFRGFMVGREFPFPKATYLKELFGVIRSKTFFPRPLSRSP